MLTNNRFPVLIFLLVIGVFYSWTLTFQDNIWLVSLGINVHQILIGIVSLVWLFQAYRIAERKQKNFWILLLVGLSLYLSSNWLWLYLQVSQGATFSDGLSYVLWLISYLFFLAALIMKTRELGAGLSRNSYLFNIAIFMITATSISLHFLINPVLELAEDSWLLTITTVVYPVADLSILFVVTILYYLIHKNQQQKMMLLCITGFLIQVMGDLLYAYQTFNESYQPGSFVDLLWLLSILFIGLAGLYAKKNTGNEKMEVRNLIENKEIIFPYLSILVLLVLVVQSYQWNFNVLSTGLLLAFFLVLGRQLQILRKNHQLMAQYRYLAYHDPLTGLRNRGNFVEEIEQILKDNQLKQAALLLIDLDHFKVINDTLGHHIGDEVLMKTAERLKGLLGPDKLLFRLGGDEFTIVLLDATEEKCIDLAEKILDLFQESLVVNEYEVNITPSIGISRFPEHGNTTEELMKNADAAMYLSKENGKNGFSFYNLALSQEMIRKMQIETELKTAIQKNQFLLYYQPKVDLLTKKIVGMEALLRWQHPELGWISPVEFIPVAEETGQIVPIGKWVLHQACQQNKRWQESGHSSLRVSVNVSVLQFKHGKFLSTVQQVLDATGLDPQFLELEITESIMQNIKESTEILESLRKMGIMTSIDDFGTGYSSLHVLQKLPIDTIKIDKSFVDDLAMETTNPMVKTIIDLGLNLNLSIIAEGIETEDQLEILIENGCSTGQGYLFSKPVAANEFEELMQITEFISSKTPA